MSRALNLAGSKIGILTVLSRAQSKQRTRWNVRCECGREYIAATSVLMNKRSREKSCGCLSHKKLVSLTKTHGLSRTPTWRSWWSMIRRCTDSHATGYENYGGRGITVCDRCSSSRGVLGNADVVPAKLNIRRSGLRDSVNVAVLEDYKIHPEKVMVDDRELGALIARHIFKSLDDRDDKCQRIEGKGGVYNVRETTLGGFCEAALASVIAEALREHRSY